MDPVAPPPPPAAAHGAHSDHLRGWLLLGAVAWLFSLAATWWLASHFAVPEPVPAAVTSVVAPSGDDSAAGKASRQAGAEGRSEKG